MGITIAIVSPCLQAVHVHAAVAALSSDELVERIPGNALDVVIVLRDLSNDMTVLDIDDAGDEIGSTHGQRLAVGAPSHVIEFLLCGTAHELDSPKLLLELTLAFERRGDVAEARLVAVARHPEEHVTVIAGGCQQLALGTEANDIDYA